MDTSEPPSMGAAKAAELPLWVDVIHDAAEWAGRVDDAALAAAMRAAFVSAKAQGPAEASLLLTGDAEIRRLNAAWRGKDEPTNVLSFPLESPGPGEAARHLGDVALGFGTVEREAREKGIPVAQHAAHLVVHGLLHLLGYDHGEDARAESMEALETAILAGLGLPDPYAPEFLNEGEAR